MIKQIICTLMVLSALILLQAQTPDLGLVTIKESATLNEAVRILELSSLKLESKKMINQSSFNGNIGIPLNNLPWRQALEMIALKNDLVIKEYPGYVALENQPPPPEIEKEAVQTQQLDLDVNAKQVRINAIALLADRAYLKSLGVDWSTLLNGKVTVHAGLSGASQVPSSIFGIGVDGSFSAGGFQIDINTLLNTIENNQKGMVIAKPNIMVTSGKTGYIQVGQDISVKSVDEAGNTTDRFFATGVIMNVEPTVVEVDGTEVIHMKMSIERSSATPGDISTIINKSKSDTELVLYDGEEAVIGGLYDTDTIKIRGGIPFLKDLPWWVLGIRYLTGYDKIETKERELVIILKTDIIENAVERALKAAKTKPASVVPPEAGGWGYDPD